MPPKPVELDSHTAHAAAGDSAAEINPEARSVPPRPVGLFPFTLHSRCAVVAVQRRSSMHLSMPLLHHGRLLQIHDPCDPGCQACVCSSPR